MVTVTVKNFVYLRRLVRFSQNHLHFKQRDCLILKQSLFILTTFWFYSVKQTSGGPADIYLLNVNNGYTITICEICYS